MEKPNLEENQGEEIAQILENVSEAPVVVEVNAEKTEAEKTSDDEKAREMAQALKTAHEDAEKQSEPKPESGEGNPAPKEEAPKSEEPKKEDVAVTKSENKTEKKEEKKEEKKDDKKKAFVALKPPSKWSLFWNNHVMNFLGELKEVIFGEKQKKEEKKK